MIASFVARNWRYAATNVRSLPAVRKAMALHVKEHPVCEFCAIPGGPVEVHHKKSVRTHPELAADPDNLLTLHARNRCHLTVGHFGSWMRINPDVDKWCNLRRGV